MLLILLCCVKIYHEYYAIVDKVFPQYLEELKGVSDGCGMPFHKVGQSAIYMWHRFLYGTVVRGLWSIFSTGIIYLYHSDRR